MPDTSGERHLWAKARTTSVDGCLDIGATEEQTMPGVPPNYRRPGQTDIASAVDAIRRQFLDVELAADGQALLERTGIVAGLASSGHTTASIEWALHDLVSAGELEKIDVHRKENAPGPLRNTVTAKPLTVTVSAYRTTDNFSISKESSVSSGQVETPVEGTRIDIAILVPLREEFRELLNEIGTEREVKQDPETGTRYYLFTKRETSREYKCVAAFVGPMGEVNAGLGASRLISQWRPQCLVVIGIAAGVNRKDVKLGDVVVVDECKSFLQNSKAVQNEYGTGFDFQLSGDAYRTNSPLRKAVANLEFTDPDSFRRWTEDAATLLTDLVDAADVARLVDEELLRPETRIIEGHAASGPTVGESVKFSDFLRRHDRKFLILEMESAGPLAAVHDFGDQIPTLVLRGVSDFGDERKGSLDAIRDGALRRWAMRNAVRMLWKLMATGSFDAILASNTAGAPAEDRPHVTSTVDKPASASIAEHAPGSPLSFEELGCQVNSVAVHVTGIASIIQTLKTYYAFEWQPASFEGENPLVYWPVKLRSPGPIHAVQCFAAVALQAFGADVYLCLDDLGEHDLNLPAHFTKTVARWHKRVRPDLSSFAECSFQSVIGRSDHEAWPIVQKWLGFTKDSLAEVLRVAKLLPRDAQALSIDDFNQRTPRRLLTPAMVWTCLAQLIAVDTNRPVITLSGFDERPLWDAWRRCIGAGSARVGHLYIPELEEPGQNDSDRPLHMARTPLNWESERDILRSLKHDLAQPNWNSAHRIISWCLAGCVSLPAFVNKSCETTYRVTIPEMTAIDPVIDHLARSIGSWILE